MLEEPGDQSFGLPELVTFAYCNGEQITQRPLNFKCVLVWRSQLTVLELNAHSTSNVSLFGEVNSLFCKVEQFPYHYINCTGAVPPPHSVRTRMCLDFNSQLELLP